MQHQTEHEITIEPGTPAVASVILLHGLGADAPGLAESARRVTTYLEAEVARRIATSRIVLAGFSQGGAVALTAGLRFPQRLAGLLALSTYQYSRQPALGYSGCEH